MKILIIDDERRIRQLYAAAMGDAGFEVLTAAAAVEAEKYFLGAAPEPDLVVSDIRMPGEDGISFMRKIKSRFPDLPFLLITAFPEVGDAVKALKLGAVDYLEKPVDLTEMAVAVAEILGARVGAQPEVPAGLTTGIVAESPTTKSLLRDICQVAKSDAGVLLFGECGVGKSLLAEFIHRASPRAGAPLVVANCPAISHRDMESRLFGSKSGGGGLFAEADGGTLVLDEIGDLTPQAQPLLLRVIESGGIAPVGGDREIEVDVRLVATTNKNLLEETRQKRFRDDLYYRLTVIAFEVPPLRRRPEDILPLARHFMAACGKGSKRFSPAAAECLAAHEWPGNARELANAVERAGILANGDIILPEHLPPRLLSGKRRGPVKTIEQLEHEGIEVALEKTEGNRTRAAKLLGISRRALIYKIKQMQD